ncbi:MAG: glucan biosynthesis protein [Gemmatimonadota bacterium]|nr:glucan biosynthesis protein [Gemmatimonadota bacterium]
MSNRLQIALTTTLVWALVACSDTGEVEPPSGGLPAAAGDAGAPRTVAHWAAEANGPTLFDHVAERARDRALTPYVAPASEGVGAAAVLDYGAYRDIRFRPDRAIWRGVGRFEIQLFHPGGPSQVPVAINVVEQGLSRRLAFEPGLFTYGERVDPNLTPSEGSAFAGFRAHYPLNDPERLDEVVVFLGASYFRLLGPGQVYGLSGRGLAVDIAEPSGEEFPAFVEFWLVQPDAEATTLTLYGLLDGPSVTGAFRFDLAPGRGGPTPAREPTVLAVDARLFFRSDVRKLGIAPLTSMYLHGGLGLTDVDDVRPRVHDSEGLLMLTSRSEWIWRPLTNGRGVRVTSLRDVGPVGFGLVQRSRAFSEYLDLEALYHRRPSYWVVPEGDWGSGGVELLEIPTTSEFNDNVVAYWMPDGAARAGDELRYRYRIVTFDGTLEPDSVFGGAVPGQTQAYVARTRIGWDALPGQMDPPPRSRRRVVVDFEGGGLERVPADVEVAASLSTSTGTVSDLRVQPIPGGGRRATFALSPDGDLGADMRLFLLLGDTAVTETWSYLWEPDLVR